MRNYFGALMRSSAMAVGGVAPPRAVPRAAASLSLEVAGELGAPAVAAQAQTAAASESVVAATARTSTERNEPADRAPAHHAQATASTSDDATATRPEARRQEIAAAQAVVSPAHEVVRAAMRWVAADPGQAALAPESAWHDERASTAAIDESAARIPAEVGIDLPDTLAPRHVVLPGDVSARQAAHPLAATAPRVPAADERMEISIGAIHLRVDAPAPQVSAGARLAPQPAVRSTPVALAPRSALARRALRRI